MNLLYSESFIPVLINPQEVAIVKQINPHDFERIKAFILRIWSAQIPLCTAVKNPSELSKLVYYGATQDQYGAFATCRYNAATLVVVSTVDRKYELLD